MKAMVNLNHIAEKPAICASAPCRIDMGGTLDISTFYYPLGVWRPSTFNLAVDLRTRVTVLPYEADTVKISSKGFKAASFPAGSAPYDHPLGLMFATADFFNVGGIHIHIESSSPPRSALGGSSSAAVALIAALLKWKTASPDRSLSRKKIALLAHGLEAGVARVPCGLQDQLAAVYGGVNAWFWRGTEHATPFVRKKILKKKQIRKMAAHILLAYCGSTHVSATVNSRWAHDFISGRHRKAWRRIAAYTREFIHAVGAGDYTAAAASMNREMALRKMMTPDVLDDMGRALVRTAAKRRCGARFTGAGGGGCVWAVGRRKDIDRLQPEWRRLLSRGGTSRLLDFNIDTRGLTVRAIDDAIES